MKIRTRLFAGLLSFVLGISAVPFPASAASHQRDEETGDVAMEGKMPKVAREVINVTLPTTQAQFDYILDPNRLILNHQSERDTQNIKVTDNGVLFANRGSDGRVTGYSGTSDPVTVYNRTPAPVIVQMTVTVNKPDANFQFAYTRDFRDKDGKEIDGRAVYLAVVNDGREIPVQEDNGTAIAVVEGWIANDERELYWDREETQYKYRLKNENKDPSAYPSTSFYMTGDATPGNWSDVTDLDARVTWSASKDTSYIGDDENPYPEMNRTPSVELVTAATVAGTQATLKADFGAGDEARTKITRFAYLDANGTMQYIQKPNTTSFIVDGTTVKVSATSAILKASRTWIEFANVQETTEIVNGKEKVTSTDVDHILAPCSVTASVNPSVVSVTQAMDPDDDAVVTVDYGKGDAKMQRMIRLEYNDIDGVKQTVLPTSTRYSTNFSVDDENTGKVATIHMVKDILIGTDWTLVMTSHDGKSTYSLPVDLRHPDSPILPEEGPRVVVDTYVSAVNGKGTLTLNYGKGAYKMDKVTGLKYVPADSDEAVTIAPGSTAFKITNTTTATVTASAAIFTAKSWTIVYGKNGSDETYDVDFTLCSIDPSVEVTTQGVDPDTDTTIAKLDFGLGANAATGVKYLRRTASDGTVTNYDAAQRTAAGITYDDETKVMTIPLSGLQIDQTDVWSIVFTNENDTDFNCPFDLIRVDRNPSVTVVTPAESINDWVEMKLDFGSGDLAATAVTNFQFVRYDSKATVTLKPGSTNFKVNGTTATVRAYALLFNSGDWCINFNNGYKATFSIFSLEPSVSNVTKVAQAGETATVEFDWGSGAKGATAVSLEYVDGNGNTQTLAAGDTNFAVSGTTASITAVSEIFNGEKWKLVFTRDDDATYSVKCDVDIIFGELPSITGVTSTDDTSGTATIEFSLGSGRRAATSVTGLKYVDANGTAQTLTSGFSVSGTTASVTFTPALAETFNAVEKWYLVFNTGYEAESTEKLYDTSVYPSVTVVDGTYAQEIGDVVSLTIDYGTGEKAATSVSSLKYIRSDTGAAVILAVNSTNFKMPDGNTGTSATATAFKLFFQGKAWYVVFDNGYEAEFSIFSEHPSITSVSPAEEIGETATVVYTLGRGADAASALTGLKYGTQTASPASNDYDETKHSGTATFTVDETMAAVSEWSLVFDNSYEVTSTEKLYEKAVYPSVIVTDDKYAENAGDVVPLTIDYGTGSKAAKTVTGLKYIRSDTGAAVTLNVNSTNFKMPDGNTGTSATITMFALCFNAKAWYMVFNTGYELELILVAKGPFVKVTQEPASVGGTATLSYSLGTGSKVTTGVRSLKYVPHGTETPVTIAANATNFRVNEDTITITAVEAIYNADSWAVVFNDDTESEFELVTIGEPPKITAVQAVLTVGEEAKITVDLGSGRSAATNVTSLKYTGSNGQTQTLTSGFTLSEDHTTVSVTVTDALSTASAWSLVFNDADSTEISRTDHLLVVNEPPSVKVNTYAQAIGDKVSLTLNFGGGTLAASKVTAMRYVRSDTGATVRLVLNSTNFKVTDATHSGTDATVTAFKLLFQGKAWYIEFDNTVLAEFSIFAVGPSIQSVTPASAVDQTATVTFDWGEDEAAASSVKSLQYLSNSGETVTLDSSKLSVSGTTATVTVTQELSETSKWWLVFNNDAKAESTESLIIVPDIDPSFEILTTPSAVGTTATFALDFGSGAGEATSVTGLTYVRSDTGASVTLKANSTNFKVNGTSATVTAFALFYNAETWYMEFNNKTIEFDLFAKGFYPRDKAPSIKSVVSADAVGSTATVTVNMGTGGKTADNVTSLKYVDSNNQTQTLTSGFSLNADGTTVSITVTEALSTAGSWSLVFNDADRTEVSCTDKLIATGPSVTVNTHPAAIGAIGTLTLDFGNGSAAATSVTGFQYVRADTGALVTLNVNSTNFKVTSPNVSGTSATVTAFKLLYEAKSWYIRFDNKTVEFELREGIEEEPSIVSVSAATEAGGSATIVYDPGKGSVAATGVTSLTYVSGGTTKTVSNLTVNASSCTITVPVVEDMANLTEWTLTFNNTKQTSITRTDALFSLDTGPSVTVVTKAPAAAQYATVTIDYGTGSLAATGLTKLSYYKNGTTWIDIDLANITNSNVSLSGNNLTIKCFTYLYNASGWKIVFRNGQEVSFNPTNRTL